MLTLGNNDHLLVDRPETKIKTFSLYLYELFLNLRTHLHLMTISNTE